MSREQQHALPSDPYYPMRSEFRIAVESGADNPFPETYALRRLTFSYW